jgi:uncharacterized protein (DUF1810 family)
MRATHEALRSALDRLAALPARERAPIGRRGDARIARAEERGPEFMDGEDQLERFVAAQADVYPRALEEVRRGAKRTHWMWFIFPQIAGLGRSAMARRSAITSVDEARSYLAHPLLGARYIDCVSALQDLGGSNPASIFGDGDAAKLRSSLTLFDAASPRPLFSAALDRWFGGERDPRTLARLAGARGLNPATGAATSGS